MSCGLFCPVYLQQQDVWLVFINTVCFIEIPVFNANSVDPDQMLYSATSDLGLHYFPYTLLEVSPN